MSGKPPGFFQEEPLSFEYPETGQRGAKLREPGVPEVSLGQALAGAALREDGLEGLPQLSEFDAVRHTARRSSAP